VFDSTAEGANALGCRGEMAPPRRVHWVVDDRAAIAYVGGVDDLAEQPEEGKDVMAYVGGIDDLAEQPEAGKDVVALMP